MKKLDPDFKAYLQLIRVLWRKKSISRDAKAVWQYLSVFENFKTNTAQPGRRTICREIHISPNYLGKVLDELAAAGLLAFSDAPSRNGQITVYTLIAPQPDVPRKSSGNVVPFPSQTSTNSTRSTTKLGGDSASI